MKFKSLSIVGAALFPITETWSLRATSKQLSFTISPLALALYWMRGQSQTAPVGMATRTLYERTFYQEQRIRQRAEGNAGCIASPFRPVGGKSGPRPDLDGERSQSARAYGTRAVLCAFFLPLAIFVQHRGKMKP